MKTKVLTHLNRINNSIKTIETKLLSDKDITPTQLEVMELIFSNEKPTTNSYLVRNARSSSPDMTRLVDRLIQKGFVTRERDGVKKSAIIISLTKDGMLFLQNLNISKKVNKILFMNLTNSEIELLGELLESM